MQFRTRCLPLIILIAFGSQNAMATKPPIEALKLLTESKPWSIEEYRYHITAFLGLATAALGTIDYKLSKANSLKAYLTGHRNLLLKNRHVTAHKAIGQLTRLAALSTLGMASYSLSMTGWNASSSNIKKGTVKSCPHCGQKISRFLQTCQKCTSPIPLARVTPLDSK